MDLLQHMTERARSLQRCVVLPEGNEPRTLRAANRILGEGLAKVILIGNADEINALAAADGLEAIAQAQIVDPADKAVIDRYAPVLLELRKSKGMTEAQAAKTAADPLYLGCLMVKTGDAYCMVAGAENTTGDVLRAAFQVIKTRPGIDVVSGAFIMIMPEGVDYGTDGIMIFADCAVVPNPDARQLAQIAVSSAETARKIAGIEPRVAMLSYSTKGSGKGDQVDKVVEATSLAHEMDPCVDLDGELQADAAIVPVV
ncbi:MAG: phosphate acetyltransferase, partial [Muribaculaceae bacterium]|nr:phosphate acetyltransferase [Muribaculaceae bacterium]